MVWYLPVPVVRSADLQQRAGAPVEHYGKAGARGLRMLRGARFIEASSMR